jgi:hypothetical protein
MSAGAAMQPNDTLQKFMEFTKMAEPTPMAERLAKLIYQPLGIDAEEYEVCKISALVEKHGEAMVEEVINWALSNDFWALRLTAASLSSAFRTMLIDCRASKRTPVNVERQKQAERVALKESIERKAGL